MLKQRKTMPARQVSDAVSRPLPGRVLLFWLALALGLVFGTETLFVLGKSLRAEKSHLATVTFYAQTVSERALSGQTAPGWAGPEYLSQAPALGPLASAADFGHNNSSVYGGGPHILYLGQWDVLRLDGQGQVRESVLDTTTEPTVSTDEDGWSDTGAEEAQSTETDVCPESNGDCRSESVEPEGSDVLSPDQYRGLDDKVTAPEAPESTVADENGAEMEIELPLEPDRSLQPDISPVGEPDIGNTSDPDLSFHISAPVPGSADDHDLNFYKKRAWGLPAASAQEYLSNLPDDWNELGELQSVVLKLSLAVRPKETEVPLGPDLSAPFDGNDPAEDDPQTGEPAVPFGTETEAGADVDPEANEQVREELETAETQTTETKIEADPALGPDGPAAGPDYPESQTGAEPAGSGGAGEEAAEADGEKLSRLSGWLDPFIRRAEAQDSRPLVGIWQSLSGEIDPQDAAYQLLETIDHSDQDNHSRSGYFEIALPAVRTWDDLRSLKIRLSGLAQEDDDLLVFIDSLWLEVKYEEETELDRLKKRQRWEEALQELSDKLVFRIDEQVVLHYRYQKNEDHVWGALKGMLGWGDFWQNVELKVSLRDLNGREIDHPLTLTLENEGNFSVQLKDPGRVLRPGKYKLVFSISDSSGDKTEEFLLEKDFSWGVLAFNSNKAVYLPGERAYLQFGVLDDGGHTICDAELEIKIKSPAGVVELMRTGGGGIERNPECAANNVIADPDYSARYRVWEPGEYEVTVTALTRNGRREIKDAFTAAYDEAVDIERSGPTRIYPWADYEMTIRVKTTGDFGGSIREVLPRSWVLKQEEVLVYGADGGLQPYNDSRENESEHYAFRQDRTDAELFLYWDDIDLPAGAEIEIRYRFDAPNVSPEFYLLGPLRLDGSDHYEEGRAWQVASDALAGVSVVEAIGIDSGTTDTVNWKTIATSTASQYEGGQTYFVYVNAGFAGDGTAVVTQFQVLYGIDLQFNGYVQAPGDANDAAQVSWFDVMTQPATPVDVLIRYRTVSGRSYALNNQIISLDLSDLDATDWAYNVNSTNVVHSNNNPQSRANVTLANADGVKDWLVFAMEEVDVRSTARNYALEIYDGSSVYMQMVKRGRNTSEILPHTVSRTFDAVAQNTNYSIRVYDTQNSNNYHQKSRVFAMNLGVFETYKNYYAANNTALATSPTWTEIANLNAGGNYAPQHSGDQLLFASWINQSNSATAGYNERLQISGSTVPSGWSWTQSPALSRTGYIVADQLANNIFARSAIPTSGYSINLAATELTGTSQTAREVAMTVFSVKKKSIHPPLLAINSVTARRDGSGRVDISIDVDDRDDDPVRVKVEFEAGGSCLFAAPVPATLDNSASAVFGAVAVDNAADYQLGTSSSWIETTSGTNTVSFLWESRQDEPAGDGVYCLRLTANDVLYDQAVPATVTVTIDNAVPGAPGPLSLEAKTGTTATLDLGSASLESNFSEYKVYYKIYDGQAPDEGGWVQASNTASNLGYQDFNGRASTTVGGLSVGVTYSFALWAYDDYGNKASSTWLSVTANTLPAATLVSAASRRDGSGRVDVSIQVSDLDLQNSLRARLEYEAGASCVFSSPAQAYIDSSPANISATFGLPVVDNGHYYQIGTSSGNISAAMGVNTIEFDWLSKVDLPLANGTYCLRLTVNDGIDDQAPPALLTLEIDNVSPSPSGPLSFGAVNHDSIAVLYPVAQPGADTNEPDTNAYRVYYREGQSGVTEGGAGVWELDSPHFDAYDFGGGIATTVDGLLPATWYVFNIWTYDAYGNKSAAEEVSVRTLETISNDYLVLVDGLSIEADDNIIAADNESAWTFRAAVTDVNGWESIDNVILRLANRIDETAPFSDLEFTWQRQSDSFQESGTDNLAALTLASSSSSNCTGNTCVLDFDLVFAKTFASSSRYYAAELSSSSLTGQQSDLYPDLYQVRYVFLDQTHYRWRNDDGGE